MQDQNQNTTMQNNPIGQDAATMTLPTMPVIPEPAVKAEPTKTEPAVKAEPVKPSPEVGKAVQADYLKQVSAKVKESENILVVMSRNPSVDEIAAATGLTLYLDGLQKHTTAVYSGTIPETLKFLKTEETFENNTASMQDFVISLDKDKADHLRYKLEGDVVKVYITPYKTEIVADDLMFSKGDYNVDLVLALNVKATGELDAALYDHSAIMRNAAIVNISRENPGKFGAVEWYNPAASSVSEMVTELILNLNGKDKDLDDDVATALLAGIVAATQRFSNNLTTPDTLKLASKLMELGADQQLISANVGDNEVIVNEMGPMQVDTGPDINAVVPGFETPEPVVATETVVVAEPVETEPMANPAAQAVQGIDEVVGPKPDEMVLPNLAAVPSEEPVTEEPKDYAAMMAQALTEPVGQAVNPTEMTIPAMPVEPEVPVAEAPMNMPPVEMPAVEMPAVGLEQQNVVPDGAELVAKPETVLPPPPVPEVGPEAMPPSLPPVQM